MAVLKTAFGAQRDFGTLAQQRRQTEEQAGVSSILLQDHLQQMEVLRNEVFAAGMAEGQKLQQQADEHQLARCMVEVRGQLETAIGEMRRLEENAQKEAILFARIFADKLARGLIQAMPIERVEDAVQTIFADVRGCPHIALRVPPALVDLVKESISQLLQERGAEIRLFVFPDPEIAIGDCKIEWAEGGFRRDYAQVLEKIDGEIAKFFPRVH